MSPWLILYVHWSFLEFIQRFSYWHTSIGVSNINWSIIWVCYNNIYHGLKPILYRCCSRPFLHIMLSNFYNSPSYRKIIEAEWSKVTWLRKWQSWDLKPDLTLKDSFNCIIGRKRRRRENGEVEEIWENVTEILNHLCLIFQNISTW